MICTWVLQLYFARNHQTAPLLEGLHLLLSIYSLMLSQHASPPMLVNTLVLYLYTLKFLKITYFPFPACRADLHADLPLQ